ncbi:MAG: 4Fe-4S dicluster domain-containing protein [Candidatus Coatesbacteria bacterium]|nr:4Fe-4S dicluster domain-containing protein [Candidatus Coatesbacteria bacterium]
MKNIIIYFLISIALISVPFACSSDKSKNDTGTAKGTGTGTTGMYYIDINKCTGCTRCINMFNCPMGAISLKKYEGHDIDKAYIDSTLCNSCGDCINKFQCQFGAIKKK